MAVEVAPHVTDCLKRRGQSLAALGRLDDALRDLNAAVTSKRKVLQVSSTRTSTTSAAPCTTGCKIIGPRRKILL